MRQTNARTFDGEREAHVVVALACTSPPDGREWWTLPLLAEELVRLEVVESVSHETVRRTVQQTRSSRDCRSSGAFPKP